LKKQPSGNERDLREACADVTLKSQSRRTGQFEFSNANRSASIEITDEGSHAWDVQSLAEGRSIVERPSVHIDLVSVDCVRKGLCKEMVTVAIDHWRFQEKHLAGDADFGVSLLFAAEPAIAGCICYMEAMMAGHTRSRLYVQTKSSVQISTHEGFTTSGTDIPLGEEFHGTYFTVQQAAQACLTTMIPGCRGFVINRNPPKDLGAKLSINDFHFKSSMELEDLDLTMSPSTSYRVQRGPEPPYELQYEPKDGHHWYRDWCVQSFKSSESPLQGPWLFL